MSRIYIKNGDVFLVKLDNSNVRYFQFICTDTLQLNSEVIRVFTKTYSISEKPALNNLVKDEVHFYAHVYLRLGIKLGYWEKVGNISDVGNIDQILFRGSDDSGSSPVEQVKVSNDWFVWHINGSFKQVGKLQGENKKAEIGVVVNPEDIITRMQTGKYDFFYPGFEYIN